MSMNKKVIEVSKVILGHFIGSDFLPMVTIEETEQIAKAVLNRLNVGGSEGDGEYVLINEHDEELSYKVEVSENSREISMEYFPGMRVKENVSIKDTGNGLVLNLNTSNLALSYSEFWEILVMGSFLKGFDVGELSRFKKEE